MLFENIQKIVDYLEARGAYDNLPVDPDDLRLALMALGYADNIEFIKFSENPNPDRGVVLGIFKIYHDREAVYGDPSKNVQIYYLGNLSPEMLRLVVCKEMSHLLLGHPTFRANNEQRLTDLVELIATENSLGLRHSASPPYQTEIMALIAALEILCPFSIRQKVLARVESGDLKGADLERWFGLPESSLLSIFSKAYLNTVGISLKNGAKTQPQ